MIVNYVRVLYAGTVRSLVSDLMDIICLIKIVGGAHCCSFEPTNTMCVSMDEMARFTGQLLTIVHNCCPLYPNTDRHNA